MGPEKSDISAREKFIRYASISALAFASSGCEKLIVSPNPTDPTKPTTTETFTPTEIPQSLYKAELIDFTSFIEENPSLVTQEIKDLNTTFQTLVSEIPALKDVTPRIWTLSINDNGPKLDESLNIAQNEETNESYLLDIVTGEGLETKRTILQEQFFAMAEINANGEYTYVSYYYRDLDGNEVEFYRQNEDGTYTYTMLDGQKINLDGYANYFGNEDSPTSGSKHLSLIPPRDNLPANLPEGTMINMELRKIIDNQDETLYVLDNSIWVEIPALPAEFFVQFPDGGFEVRTDGVYAPDATGNMRLWYEKQPDDTLKEIYFRYGEALTEEKKMKLANRLVCERAETCISAGNGSGFANAFFEFISTGIVEKQAVVDPQTGKLKGYFWDMLVVSRDINQNPITARELLEVELLGEPGINQYTSVSQAYSLDMGWGPDGQGDKILGVDDWKNTYQPEGRMRTIVIPETVTNIDYFERLENMLGYFGDKTHFESAFKFAVSRGVDNNSEFILLFFGEKGRMVK